MTMPVTPNPTPGTPAGPIPTWVLADGTTTTAPPILYNDGLWRLTDGTIVPDPADATAPADPFATVPAPALPTVPVVVAPIPGPATPVTPTVPVVAPPVVVPVVTVPGTTPPLSPVAPTPANPVVPAPVAPVTPVAPAPAPVAPVTFLPPTAPPGGGVTPAPTRPAGAPLVAGQLVAYTDQSGYGDPTRAGIVLQVGVTAEGVNTAILGWLASTSHPIDTANLSVL